MNVHAFNLSDPATYSTQANLFVDKVPQTIINVNRVSGIPVYLVKWAGDSATADYVAGPVCAIKCPEIVEEFEKKDRVQWLLLYNINFWSYEFNELNK